MKKLLFSSFFSFAFCTLSAQHILPLWPDGDMPGNNRLKETTLEDGSYRNVTSPEMEIYLPAAKCATGQAVVICPGGGYGGLAINHEGRDVAQWLTERGVAGIVLKYRMPGGRKDIPRSDIQKAIETIRENAALWNIDPAKVGVMGFSAGGHLASTAVTHFTEGSNRPDFGILVYPVISMKDELAHNGSRKNLTGKKSYSAALDEFSNETRVTPQTPPVLILYSHDDDVVDVRNGIVFYQACVENGVPAELHTFTTGGHGWGWREDFQYSREMKAITERWLAER